MKKRAVINKMQIKTSPEGLEKIRHITDFNSRIGIRSAVQLMSSIIDINRFRPIDQFCAYFGIVPCVRDSSGKENHSYITKAGDPMMRAILNRSAFIHIQNYELSITRFMRGNHQSIRRKRLQQHRTRCSR